MLHFYYFIYWEIPRILYLEIPNNILLFSADRLISCCSRHDPGENIREKASVVSFHEAGGSSKGWGVRGGQDFNEAGGNNFRGQNALRNLLGPKGHLIIDSNSAKTITVWDYKCTKNGSTHIEQC